MPKGRVTGSSADQELEAARKKSRELVSASLEREARRAQAKELSAAAKGPTGRKRRRAMTNG